MKWLILFVLVILFVLYMFVSKNNKSQSLRNRSLQYDVGPMPTSTYYVPTASSKPIRTIPPFPYKLFLIPNDCRILVFASDNKTTITRIPYWGDPYETDKSQIGLLGYGINYEEYCKLTVIIIDNELSTIQYAVVFDSNKAEIPLVFYINNYQTYPAQNSYPKGIMFTKPSPSVNGRPFRRLLGSDVSVINHVPIVIEPAPQCYLLYYSGGVITTPVRNFRLIIQAMDNTSIYGLDNSRILTNDQGIFTNFPKLSIQTVNQTTVIFTGPSEGNFDVMSTDILVVGSCRTNERGESVRMSRIVTVSLTFAQNIVSIKDKITGYDLSQNLIPYKIITNDQQYLETNELRPIVPCVLLGEPKTTPVIAGIADKLSDINPANISFPDVNKSSDYNRGLILDIGTIYDQIKSFIVVGLDNVMLGLSIPPGSDRSTVIYYKLNEPNAYAVLNSRSYEFGQPQGEVKLDVIMTSTKCSEVVSLQITQIDRDSVPTITAANGISYTQNVDYKFIPGTSTTYNVLVLGFPSTTNITPFTQLPALLPGTNNFKIPWGIVERSLALFIVPFGLGLALPTAIVRITALLGAEEFAEWLSLPVPVDNTKKVISTMTGEYKPVLTVPLLPNEQVVVDKLPSSDKSLSDYYPADQIVYSDAQMRVNFFKISSLYPNLTTQQFDSIMSPFCSNNGNITITQNSQIYVLDNCIDGKPKSIVTPYNFPSSPTIYAGADADLVLIPTERASISVSPEPNTDGILITPIKFIRGAYAIKNNSFKPLIVCVVVTGENFTTLVSVGLNNNVPYVLTGPQDYDDKVFKRYKIYPGNPEIDLRPTVIFDAPFKNGIDKVGTCFYNFM